MDFRDYDPAVGRWTGIDPVTHYNMSPYMAFDGNPVFWADPSGADSVDGIVFSGDAAAAVFQSIISAMDHFGDNAWSIGAMDVSGEEHENIAGFNLGGSGGGAGSPGGITIRYGGFLGIGTKTVQYVNGKLIKDGQPYTGKVKGFLRSVVGALDKIGIYPIGQQLINALSNGTSTVVISRGSNSFDGLGISWNPRDNTGAIDINGSTNMPAFISLAHELAHNFDFRFDSWRGYNRQGDWFPDIRNAEIYAGNVENLIRQEHHLPQRAYYGIDPNGNGFGTYNTNLYQIINNIQDARLY